MNVRSHYRGYTDVVVHRDPQDPKVTYDCDKIANHQALRHKQGDTPRTLLGSIYPCQPHDRYGHPHGGKLLMDQAHSRSSVLSSNIGSSILKAQTIDIRFLNNT